jgi:hypothetical protein
LKFYTRLTDEGEIFSVYSSFKNGDAFRFAHPEKLENSCSLDKVCLLLVGVKFDFQHIFPLQLEEKYRLMKTNRKNYDDWASNKFARFNESKGHTPTRWNGDRDFFRDDVFLCNSKPFPDESFNTRPRPLSSSTRDSDIKPRSLTTDIMCTNFQHPSDFGVLRLYKTPTHSSLRKLQARVEGERDRVRKRAMGVF